MDPIKQFLAAMGMRTHLTDALYILDADGAPQKADDMLTWAEWMASEDRAVAKDMDEGPGAEPIEVSTVFMGRNMDHFETGAPILWETMVFGGPLDRQGERYRSRAAALAGHQAMCQRVRAALGKQ